jgi:hypothetical protein
MKLSHRGRKDDIWKASKTNGQEEGTMKKICYELRVWQQPSWMANGGGQDENHVGWLYIFEEGEMAGR